MEMRTYTQVWRLQRRLAHIHGLRLPVVWTLATFGAWLVLQLCWAVLFWSFTDIGGPTGLALVIGPPVIAASLIERIRIDERPLPAAVAAWLRWRCEPAELHGGRRPRRPPHRLHTRLWIAHPHEREVSR